MDFNTSIITVFIIILPGILYYFLYEKMRPTNEKKHFWYEFSKVLIASFGAYFLLQLLIFSIDIIGSKPTQCKIIDYISDPSIKYATNSIICTNHFLSTNSIILNNSFTNLSNFSITTNTNVILQSNIPWLDIFFASLIGILLAPILAFINYKEWFNHLIRNRFGLTDWIGNRGLWSFFLKSVSEYRIIIRDLKVNLTYYGVPVHFSDKSDLSIMQEIVLSDVYVYDFNKSNEYIDHIAYLYICRNNSELQIELHNEDIKKYNENKQMTIAQKVLKKEKKNG